MISWRDSIVNRYAAVSLLIALVPMLAIVGAYDRYSVQLNEALTGERMERRLLAMSSRMNSFIDAKNGQLDTLTNYPGIAALVNPDLVAHDESSLHAVVELEASQPDLYGILLYGADGALRSSSPGQSASGPPYWGGVDERFLNAARWIDVRGAVGPFEPSYGRPGSLLMIQEIPGSKPGGAPEGWIALHVRLASLTEIMAGDDSNGLFKTALLTPDGAAYSNVGVKLSTPSNLVSAPLSLPGWKAGLVAEIEQVWHPLNAVRNYLIIVSILAAVGVFASFFLLSRRLQRPIRELVQGSKAISEGNLSWRLKIEGDSEIALLAMSYNQMAERLEKLLKSAVETEKMVALGRFATSLAHELRNPLSTVKTTVQALLATEPIGDRRDILHNVEDEIDRLDRTLGDLLMYARPRPPRRRNVVVWDALERMSAMTSKLLQEHRISLVSLGEPNLEVSADPGHVTQVIINLILNAMEAMENGGVMTIRTRREGRFGIIELSDTGKGMSQDVLERATEPFFTTRHDGTGLGLSVSRQLVELNGGKLEFVSTPGEGTTATIRLPLATVKR